LVLFIFRFFEKHVFNSCKIFVFNLFRPICNFLHSNSPIFEFYFRSCISWLFLIVRVIIQKRLNLSKPLTEFFFKIKNFFSISSWWLIVQFVLFISIQLEKFLSWGHWLNWILNFTCEFSYKRLIFFLDFVFTLSPLIFAHLLNHWIISILDHFVQLNQALRWNFSKNDFIIICFLKIDFIFNIVFVNWEIFDKVNSLFFQFFLVSVGQEKGWVSSDFSYFSFTNNINYLIID